MCVFDRSKIVQEAVRSGYRAAYATDNWKRRHSGPGVNGKLTLYSSFASYVARQLLARI